MDADKQLDIIRTNVAELISEDEILYKLKSKRKLRVKLGIDPSGPEIHLGFSVVLRKLRQFQDLGHTAVMVVGDFTGMIGDPSGVSKTRPKLTKKQVAKNMTKYKQQIFRILDPKRTEFTYNSKWLGALSMYDLVELASKYTVARILERDDFSQRLKDGLPVYMHEILYPLCQGYDSVAIRADVELGGTDQKFNLLVGRELMRESDMEPQVVLMMPILEGTDGVRKMSKSFNNYIGITESPKQMLGKIMSLPDEHIIKYFKLATDAFPHRVEEYRMALEDASMNPRDAKLDLAKTLVRMYHSAQAAQKTAEDFQRVFTQRELPEKIDEYKTTKINNNIIDLLVESKLMSSRSEAKRKVREGAIDIDGVRVDDINYSVALTQPVVLRAGKHKFLRVSKK
ncbi:MAG: tyrosine--tRNA ligase [candidate division WOR-3 bacterium]|nr:MAG: tyrosine--tRNA ligase [candidate division WOR-3 bacterium]